MKYKTVILISLTGVILAAAGCKTSPHCCLIATPSLTLTPEKTPIERQIVGDYMELEKDAWVVSSVKTTYGSRTSGSTTGDPEILKAERVRQFHADVLNGYKAEGAAGEGNDGYVAYIKTDRYETDPAQKRVLLAVIDEENSARMIIFRRSLFSIYGKEPSGQEVSAFGRTFADEQRVLARKGEWIQENSGKWVKKR